MRDHRDDYAKAGAVVLGVSPDPVAKVKKFHDKQALDFTAARRRGASRGRRLRRVGEKSMYGRTFWGVQRATFIIDPDGSVASVIPKVSPKTHDAEVLHELTALSRA